MNLESKNTPSPITTEILKNCFNKIIPIKNHRDIKFITISTINDPQYSVVINYKDGRDTKEFFFPPKKISLVLIYRILSNNGIDSENLDLNNLK